MKPILLLAPLTCLLLAACAEPEPAPPVVVERHYYRTTERQVTSTPSRPRKASPSVTTESAESFRAVERPSSYSQ